VAGAATGAGSRSRHGPKPALLLQTAPAPDSAGDQNPTRRIYMPTTNFTKTSSDVLRTFKSFGASCYSGLPVFPTETRPDGQNPRYTGF
jgi:hypothetical protein